jgi:predicted O-methyltransferase YrrM
MKKLARKFWRGVSDYILERRYSQLHAAFSISSHLTRLERIALYRLARSAPVIAEIGSYQGASSCCFGAARAELAAGRVICIDTWSNDAMSEGPRDTWQEFYDNTRLYRDRITPIRGFSTEVVESVRQETPHLDLLFIDGDHEYVGVKADWDAYRTLLRVGSVVAFHDYGWAEGVRRVVHEEVSPLVDTYQQLPNLWWGRIGRRE